jgi:hypothetical protein
MSRTAMRLALHGLAPVSWSLLAACGPKGLDPWQEEFRLNDGRKIVVERY